MMLPALRKPNDQNFNTTEPKVYDPPSELSQHHSKRDQISRESGRNTNKTKIGGGFKLSNVQEESKPESTKVYDSYNNYNSRSLALSQKKSSSDIGQEIRLIQRKIRQCQKKIEDEKRRKLEEEKKVDDNYNQDFQQIIRRELELQGYKQDQNKGFDYLTNPGGPPPEQEPQQSSAPEPQPQAPYNIADNIDKLQRFYQNSLKKKFERREVFPHKQCRRRTPKLYITQKTNAVSKSGKVQSQQEHKFRVFTKQTTPQEIYPVIPNFPVVKDNLSKNIIAYLGDYKPFIEKTKEKNTKETNKPQPEIVIDNASKHLTVTN